MELVSESGKGRVWFSPNLVFSDAEREKNQLLSARGLPRDSRK